MCGNIPAFTHPFLQMSFSSMAECGSPGIHLEEYQSLSCHWWLVKLEGIYSELGQHGLGGCTFEVPNLDSGGKVDTNCARRFRCEDSNVD